MAYRGNAAYQLDASQSWEVPVRRPLSVHEGGGLDARSRREASTAAAAIVKAVVALAVTFVLIGAARVALTAQTVSLLSQIRTAENTISQARDTRTELSVERSTLASTDRIQRIATENYGMVYAAEVDTIVLSHDSAEASADDAQSGDAADAASPEA